jgi:hypothetical protein
MSAVPTDADALPFLPSFDARADGIDYTGDLMPRNPWILQAWPQAIFRQHVTVTDATGLNPDEHVSFAGLWHIPFDKFKRTTRLSHLYCFHRPHRFLPLKDANAG